MRDVRTLNVTESYTLLGVSRQTFYDLRKRVGLQRLAWSSERSPRYRREDIEALGKSLAPLSVDPDRQMLIEEHQAMLAALTMRFPKA